MTSPDTRRRVGLLGGTFDPPHLGHLVAAEEARVSLELDEVRLLVAGDPWMKRTVSAAEHRVRMAELAVADHDALGFDAREARRDGPTYTADTLEELRDEAPDTAWFFLLGADAAQKLGDWRRVDAALALATFVVLTRPGYAPRPPADLDGRVEPLEIPPIGISSTDLRRRFREGRAVRYQLPRAVERYVREHGLYGSHDA